MLPPPSFTVYKVFFVVMCWTGGELLYFNYTSKLNALNAQKVSFDRGLQTFSIHSNLKNTFFDTYTPNFGLLAHDKKV